MDSIPCFDGRLFTWSGNEGFVEASDLGIKHALAEFNVKSHRTGQVLKFVHKHAELDRENELVAHAYQAGGIVIRIFND